MGFPANHLLGRRGAVSRAGLPDSPALTPLKIIMCEDSMAALRRQVALLPGRVQVSGEGMPFLSGEVTPCLCQKSLDEHYLG